MSLIQSADVVLINKVQTGTDEFGRPIYSETETTVSNVLFAPTTETDLINSLDLNGKKDVFTIGLPKGDTHIWQDQDVVFGGHRYHVFTPCIYGIEANVPTEWHHKYLCERYE